MPLTTATPLAALVDGTTLLSEDPNQGYFPWEMQNQELPPLPSPPAGGMGEGSAAIFGSRLPSHHGRPVPRVEQVNNMVSKAADEDHGDESSNSTSDSDSSYEETEKKTGRRDQNGRAGTGTQKSVDQARLLEVIAEVGPELFESAQGRPSSQLKGAREAAWTRAHKACINVNKSEGLSVAVGAKVDTFKRNAQKWIREAKEAKRAATRNEDEASVRESTQARPGESVLSKVVATAVQADDGRQEVRTNLSKHDVHKQKAKDLASAHIVSMLMGKVPKDDERRAAELAIVEQQAKADAAYTAAGKGRSAFYSSAAPRLGKLKQIVRDEANVSDGDEVVVDDEDDDIPESKTQKTPSASQRKLLQGSSKGKIASEMLACREEEKKQRANLYREIEAQKMKQLREDREMDRKERDVDRKEREVERASVRELELLKMQQLREMELLKMQQLREVERESAQTFMLALPQLLAASAMAVKAAWYAPAASSLMPSFDSVAKGGSSSSAGPDHRGIPQRGSTDSGTETGGKRVKRSDPEPEAVEAGGPPTLRQPRSPLRREPGNSRSVTVASNSPQSGASMQLNVQNNYLEHTGGSVGASTKPSTCSQCGVAHKVFPDEDGVVWCKACLAAWLRDAGQESPC